MNKDKLSRAFDILCAMPVTGDNQERIVQVKQLIKEVYGELDKPPVDHEYNKEG